MKVTLSTFLIAGFCFAQSAVVQRNVNLRADPSTDNPPLALLTPPTVLSLLKNTKQAGYYHVRTASSQEGWVWAKNVMLSNAAAPGDPDKTCMLHSDNMGCYEEDHLISLENGGHPRDSRNLWPEPYFTRIDGKVVGARQKDVVENYIRNAICFNIAGYVSKGTKANASLALKRGQEISLEIGTRAT